MKSLSGKRALVTGGTRGIGAAIAAKLAAEGADVVVTCTRKPARKLKGECRFVDFAVRRELEAFAAELKTMRIDVLVNNAGINKIAAFDAVDPADFDRILEVNLRAPFRLCQAVLPYMRRRGWGRIVNISSVFSLVSREQRGAYSASKFGLDGLTAALAAEAASYGVLANCVAPGFIDTELTRRIVGQAGMKELAARVPAKRLGRPEEIAELVAWLAGPKNSYVSGQNLVIDGGFSRV